MNDSNASGPQPVNNASVPPLPSNSTQSAEQNRNTAQDLVASLLHRYNLPYMVHCLLISLILVLH